MSRYIKKILLSSLAFLAVLCFTLPLLFSATNLTKADVKLQIVEVKQTFIHLYNSIDAYGYRTEYTIKFSEDVFSDSDAVGEFAYATNFAPATATIENADVNNMISKIKINNGYLTGDKIQGYGVAVSKVANDTIKLHIGQPIGFTRFTFEAGLTVNGNALDKNVVLYQETDNTFTTIEPEMKVFAVYTMPHGTGPRISIWMTKSATNANGLTSKNGFDLVTLNNVPLTYGGALTIDWNNYWDDAIYLLGANPYFNQTAFNDLASPLTLTFKEGFRLSDVESEGIVEEQTFILTNKSAVQDWGTQSKFIPIEDYVPIEGELEVTSVEKTFIHGYNGCDSLGYRSEYVVTFDADLFNETTPVTLTQVGTC